MQTAQTTRRTEAIAAATPTDSARALADSKRRLAAGTGTRSDAERIDALDAIKAGAIARERESALELVALVQAQIAAGITPTAGAYVLKHDADGEPIDARDIVAAALAPRSVRDAAGKVIGSTPSRRATRAALPWQITDTDLTKLAWGAVKVAARAAAGSTPEAFRDAHAAAVLAMIEAAPSAPCSCTGSLSRRYGSPLTFIAAVERGDFRAECPRCNGRRRVAQMDRRVCATDDLAKAGRNAAQRELERDRRAAPLDADELSARADAAAAEALDVASVTAEELADALHLTGKAERAALLIECGGVTRADLARAAGVTAEAAKKAAQRGRKALAAKLADPAMVSRAARAVIAADPQDPAAAERKIRALVDGKVRSGERSLLAWPDRMAEYGEDGSLTLPTRTGSGERGRITHHGGAPALPACFLPAAAAPWSSAEHAAASERRATRRAIERARLAPFRTPPPRRGSSRAVCAFLRSVDALPDAAPLMHRSLTYGPLPAPQPAPPTHADAARMEARRRALVAAAERSALAVERQRADDARRALAAAAWHRVWSDEDRSRADADAARDAILNAA